MRYAIPLLCIFFCFTALDAQARTVEIQPTGETLIVTEPGRIVTSAVSITNRSPTAQEFSLTVNLPKTWVLITKGFPITLDKDASDVQLISFLVPQNALAENYPVTYTVQGTVSPALSDSFGIHVVVLPITKLSLSLMEVPRYVIAGDEYAVTFAVVNESNIHQNVRLNVESTQRFPFVVDAMEFALEAGESRKVAIRVRTDKQLRETLRHIITVTAQIPGKDNTQVEAQSSVEVIPPITGAENRYHTLPTEMTLRYVGNSVGGQKESGFQGQLSGNGTLTESGQQHVSFLFKGPDLYKQSDLSSTMYRTRDEYRMNLWDEHYELMLGDQNYSLSPLTELSLYGRGAGGKATLDKLQFGAYRMATRWFDLDQDQTALFTNYALNDNLKVGLNFLKKNTPDGTSHITSVSSQIRPIKTTYVNLEYGRGETQTDNNNAYSLDVSGNQALLAYSLNYIHAEPNYPGSYRDMDYLTTSITIPLQDRFRLSANFRQDKRNLDLDPTKDSATFERTYQAGINYRVDPSMNLGFDMITRIYKDRLTNPKFDFTENTGRLSLSKGLAWLNFFSSAQVGKERDWLDNSSSMVENYTLSAYVSPFKNQTYSGYLYYDKNRPEQGGLQTCLTLGVRTAFQIGTGTRFDLNYETRNYKNYSQSKENIYEIHLSQTLFHTHRLSLLGRYMTYDNALQENESAYMIEYTIPFDLPVSKVQSYGTVMGSLYNVETNAPIMNAIVRLNGTSTVTDKRGEFTFNSIKPGNYFIDIDSASVGLDKISAQKTPIKVLVQGGEISLLKLAITRTAAFKGRVMAYQIDKDSPAQQNVDTHALSFVMDPKGGGGILAQGDDSKIIEVAGVASVVVTLKNETEEISRITDSQGHFAFEELRPGTWTMSIDETKLPPNHTIMDNERMYALAPGETKDVLAKVVPMKRTIQIVEEREIPIENPVTKQAAPKTTNKASARLEPGLPHEPIIPEDALVTSVGHPGMTPTPLNPTLKTPVKPQTTGDNQALSSAEKPRLSAKPTVPDGPKYQVKITPAVIDTQHPGIDWITETLLPLLILLVVVCLTWILIRRIKENQ